MKDGIALNQTYFGGDRRVVVCGTPLDGDHRQMCRESDRLFEGDGHRPEVITRSLHIDIAAFDIEPLADGWHLPDRGGRRDTGVAVPHKSFQE